MIARPLLLAAALLAASATAALAQARDVVAPPTLRANVTVASDIVRVGDLVDNAGIAGATAVYRAPDLGTTGTLPVTAVLAILRSHQVIGVDARDLKEITVTRLARTIEARELELSIARALERRHGLGEAANLNITLDRDVGDLRLEAAVSGALQPTSVRYDGRSTRFDVTFEIASENGTPPAKLRFTGTAIETVEAAVLARNLERGDVLKSSDVIVERRPKAEIGTDPAGRERAVGMQARRQLRAGQALRVADLSKPDLVTRDQNVTLIYETAGLYLTIRGKAMDNGTEGDVVSVMNLQSKRVVSGVVIGRGQVAISVATPRLGPEANAAPSSALGAAAPAASAPVSVANVSSVALKAE